MTFIGRNSLFIINYLKLIIAFPFVNYEFYDENWRCKFCSDSDCNIEHKISKAISIVVSSELDAAKNTL